MNIKILIGLVKQFIALFEVIEYFHPKSKSKRRRK